MIIHLLIFFCNMYNFENWPGKSLGFSLEDGISISNLTYMRFLQYVQGVENSENCCGGI